MESLSFIDLGKPKITSIEISTQGSLGTGKGLYNTWGGFTIDLACLQVMHLSQIIVSMRKGMERLNKSQTKDWFGNQHVLAPFSFEWNGAFWAKQHRFIHY
jgi:hypothetical protein